MERMAALVKKSVIILVATIIFMGVGFSMILAKNPQVVEAFNSVESQMSADGLNNEFSMHIQNQLKDINNVPQGKSLTLEGTEQITPFIDGYTITYINEAGEPFDDKIIQDWPRVHMAGSTTVLPIYEKEGGVFKGWYTDSACKESQKIEKITELSNDITLYASWAGMYESHVFPGDWSDKLKDKLNIDKSNISTITFERLSKIPSGYEEEIQLADYVYASYRENGRRKYDVVFWSNSIIYAPEDCKFLFKDCEIITSINFDNFYTDNATNMSYMFANCYSLDSLDLPSTFNTSSVTDMSFMFYNASSLNYIEFSLSFNTRNVTLMTSMFVNCYSLNSLDLPSTFDTSSVTSMESMFYNCSQLNTLTIPESFDTSSVVNMSNMFGFCERLHSLDLPSTFDTSSVTDMQYLFNRCRRLTNLNFLTSFNTSRVRNMEGLFYECSSLTTLDISMFDMTNAFRHSNMFDGMTKLLLLKTPYVLESKTIILELPKEMYYQDRTQPDAMKTYTLLNSSKTLVIGYEITYKDKNGGDFTGDTAGLPTVHLYSQTTALVNPQKAGYSFDGWYLDEKCEDNKVTGLNDENCTGDITLYAKWKVNEYTITWKNDDGSIIDTTAVAYGDVPTHADVTKTATAQYTYTFAGWTPEVVAVTGDATYTATFTETINCYKVTINVNNANFGSVTNTEVPNVPYGTAITIVNNSLKIGELSEIVAIPNDSATPQITYKFDGWTPVVNEVTGAITITANFKQILNCYTVTIAVNNSNWGCVDIIEVYEVPYGTNILANGEKLTIVNMVDITATANAKTPEFTYEFNYWADVPNMVLGDTTITAVFAAKISVHQIIYKNKNGDDFDGINPVDAPNEYRYGDTITLPTPVKENFDFSGWYLNSDCIGEPITIIDSSLNLMDIILYAKWKKITVLISFVNFDGSILYSNYYEIGEMPSYNGVPTKDADAQYSYQFVGWTPEIEPATTERTYRAEYEYILNSYRVELYYIVDGDIVDSSVDHVYYGYNYTVIIPNRDNCNVANIVVNNNVYEPNQAVKIENITNNYKIDIYYKTKQSSILVIIGIVAGGLLVAIVFGFTIRKNIKRKALSKANKEYDNLDKIIPKKQSLDKQETVIQNVLNETEINKIISQVMEKEKNMTNKKEDNSLKPDNTVKKNNESAMVKTATKVQSEASNMSVEKLPPKKSQ